MEKRLAEGITFDRLDTANPLQKADYDNCRFTNCDLPGADLGGSFFMECVFENCNLSNAILKGTALRDVRFVNCKLLGLPFNDCNTMLFEVNFEGCALNMCAFIGCKMKKTIFRKCDMREADLSEADLTEAVFNDCELSGAVFDHTLLEKADLRNAWNYSIDPQKNKIKKAKFSLSGLPGLLHAWNISVEQ